MPSREPQPDEPQPQGPGSEGTPAPRILKSEDLLQGAREVVIEHGDERYRLRLTRNGRLYLTK